MFENKTVVLGVTGSIASYKVANLASLMVKKGINVQVIMTKNACNFISPLVFEELTGNRCLVDTFDRNFEFKVEHISIAKKASLFIIAPATANVIAKVANGIADDMLTTTFLACTCPKLIAPAMNTAMLENSITQENIEKCRKHGMKIIESASGRLACGTVGKGKMPEPETLFKHIEKEIAYEKDLLGKKVLVTAGPTQEALDPVRYITNHSSGKMGYAIAKNASLRGAEVTLVSGPVSLEAPLDVNVINVKSSAEMAKAVKENFLDRDIVIKAAAVADYRPKVVSENKIKKHDGELSLSLERTEDILLYLGEHKRKGQFICGFSMETENLIENSKAKLTKKNADMIVANSLKTEGAGFGVDTNAVTIITKNNQKKFSVMSKDEVAEKILDEIKNEFGKN